MFKCEFCGKELSSKKLLKKHRDTFHSDKISYEFVCEICNSGFDELSFLIVHLKKSHKDIDVEQYYNEKLFGRLKCKYCGENLPYKRFSGFFCNQQHYESYNRREDIKYVCEICKAGFEEKGRLQQHLGRLHPEVNQEEYYRKYILKEDEPDGKCLYCNKDVDFSSFTDGYNRFCYNTECNVKWYNENTDRKEKRLNRLVSHIKMIKVDWLLI